MLAHYLKLAWRSLARSKAFTALTILTLALGIGACITTLTVFRLLSGDPVPQKSGNLFYPQLDPYPKDEPFSRSGKMPWLMTYVDAMNLLRDHRAERQAAIAMTNVKITPSLGTQQRPFFGDGVMTTADFFPMFDTPFRYGSGWTAADDERRAPIVVIADSLNDRLFGGIDSVGRSVRINGNDFRIVGVLEQWPVQPRFYGIHLGGHDYGKEDAVYLPLQAARAAGMEPKVTLSFGPSEPSQLETDSSIWLGVWVQLSTPASVASYRNYLENYAGQQMAAGRFERSRVALSGLMAWLHDQRVVPDDVRMQVWLAFGFLLICTVNAVGLMLTKCLGRSREIGVRRALGATRSAIFTQFMVEAGLGGLTGGVLGLLFAEAGLWAVRQEPVQYASLAHLDLGMFVMTFLIALPASLMAGLLPAWRACALMPAPNIKA